MVKPLADRYLNLVDPFYHFISSLGNGGKEGKGGRGEAILVEWEGRGWNDPFGLR